MDQWDCNFDLNGAFEKVFHKLRENRVGAVVKHAAVITLKKQGLLWTAGPLVLLIVNANATNHELTIISFTIYAHLP